VLLAAVAILSAGLGAGLPDAWAVGFYRNQAAGALPLILH
jgi:hypothetical protein